MWETNSTCRKEELLDEEPFLWKTNTEEYGEEEVLLKYGIYIQGICIVDFHK